MSRKRRGGGRSPRDTIQETIDALRFEAEQLGRTSQEQRLYNELKRAGVSLNSEAGQKIQELVQRIETQEAAQERLRASQERLNETMEEMGSLAGDALASIISGSEDAEKAVARLAIQLAQAALQASNLAGGNSFFGGFLNSLLGGFGGFFAKGGRLGAGQWGIAGEAGPEIVHGPATITPIGNVVPPAMAQRGGASAVVNMPVTINAQGADPAALERVRRSVDELGRNVPKMVDSRMKTSQVRGVRA